MFTTSENTDQIYKAIQAVQMKVSTIKKTAINSLFDSRYADINTIIQVLRPVLAENELNLILPPTGYGNDAVEVTCQLYHLPSDQWIRASSSFPVVKKDPQAGGSVCTYLRRYLIVGLFNLEQVDDDCNSNVNVITNMQGVCIIAKDGKPRPLSQMTGKQLKELVKRDEYEPAHKAAKELLAEQWNAKV